MEETGQCRAIHHVFGRLAGLPALNWLEGITGFCGTRACLKQAGKLEEESAPKKGDNMVTTHRVALDELVFQYQLLHKNEVVYIGRSNNPSARMMEHWKDGKKFDRIEIEREEPTPLWQAEQIEKDRIARYQRRYGRPPRYNKNVPLPVKEGTRLPAPKERTPTFVYWNGRRTEAEADGGMDNRDEATQHYLIGRKTACGLWKGKLATTRQPNQVTCGSCQNTWVFHEAYEDEYLDDGEDCDEPTLHFLAGRKTACGRSQRGLETTVQPNQVTCGNCRVTDLFRSEFYDVDDDEDCDEEDWDEPTQHYPRNKTMTACGLRKKNGMETTRQRSQVTCGNCLRSQRLHS